jgi:triacylglycerol lipase
MVKELVDMIQFPPIRILVGSALILMIGLACGTGHADENNAPEARPRVILLHGLGRTCRSMAAMAAFLEDRGYAVVNVDYPSRKAPVETLSRDVLATAVARCRMDSPSRPIHLVTHSLGGIVARYYLQDHTLPPGSRIVMLSPPNRGSEVADMLKDYSLYRRFMGPAGGQLGTAPDALPNRLAPVDVPVGIITGDTTLDPWFSWRISGPDDGKVAVERAKLPEMNDFLVVHKSHALIMQDTAVMAQTAYFLEHGTFDREE